MPKVTLRPTIPADLPHLVGEPLPYRIRAITALVGDRVIGMGGIAFPPFGPAIAFVQLVPSSREDAAVGDGEHSAANTPDARRYPVAFHRAGLMAMEMIRTSGVTQVVATADASSDVAVRWLKRLGFQPAEDQRIAGKLLFNWERKRERARGASGVCEHGSGRAACATAPVGTLTLDGGAAPSDGRLAQLSQFARCRDDFAGAGADKCESSQWEGPANRL